MTKRRVLITGGAGNVGSSLAAHISSQSDHEVLLVDNLQTGSLRKTEPAVAGGARFIRADVNAYEEILPAMTAFRPDVVFHYAATVGVARTLSNPMCVLKDIDGIRNILNISKGIGVERVFFSSSSEVYGEPVEIPQREETTPLNSRLPYAVIKNLGEIYCKSYFKEYNLSYTVFRLFNTYGPSQSTDFVISKFITQALAGGPITIYGDGEQTRTFCYVTDSVEFQYRCLADGLFVNDTVNVGSDEEIRIVDLADMVREIVNPAAEIIHLPALAEGDMSRRCPDISRMSHALQRPLRSLHEGITLTADYLRGPAAA